MPVRKNQKVIGLIKSEKDSKIIPKFVGTAPKSYSHCVQKDDYGIEDLKFIGVAGLKKISK